MDTTPGAASHVLPAAPEFRPYGAGIHRDPRRTVYGPGQGGPRYRRATALGANWQHGSGEDGRAPEPVAAPRRVDPWPEPLRLRPDPRRRGRRAGRRVARRLAVLQPQPRGLAGAGAAVPAHQHGAVR